jgi:hypothetical protein
MPDKVGFFIYRDYEENFYPYHGNLATLALFCASQRWRWRSY